MLVFVVVPVLDVVTGEIEVGERVHTYEERSSFVIGVQDDLHYTIANVNDIADETLLFTIKDLDPVSNLDHVLGEMECY